MCNVTMPSLVASSRMILKGLILQVPTDNINRWKKVTKQSWKPWNIGDDNAGDENALKPFSMSFDTMSEDSLPEKQAQCFI